MTSSVTWLRFATWSNTFHKRLVEAFYTYSGVFCVVVRSIVVLHVISCKTSWQGSGRSPQSLLWLRVWHFRLKPNRNNKISKNCSVTSARLHHKISPSVKHCLSENANHSCTTRQTRGLLLAIGLLIQHETRNVWVTYLPLAPIPELCTSVSAGTKLLELTRKWGGTYRSRHKARRGQLCAGMWPPIQLMISLTRRNLCRGPTAAMFRGRWDTQVQTRQLEHIWVTIHARISENLDNNWKRELTPWQGLHSPAALDLFHLCLHNS